MLWDYQAPSAEAVDHLKTALGISQELASMLVQRGWTEPEASRRFLHPRLAHLEDPFQLSHLEEGVDRLLAAMQDKQRIVILGDYDVDGVTSTTLLISILKCLGTSAKFVLPKRLEEGYGLTQAVADRLVAEHEPDLLIALDCGTNAVEQVKGLRAKEIDVIIIDHHRSKEGTPDDCILINPHVFDDASKPWVNLCTVGLVFKFVHGLLKKLRDAEDARALEIKLRDYLDLVAMGTVADLVPLLGENRLITRYGLEQLRKTQRPGLRALYEVSGLSCDFAVQPVDIGFRLGPRINASGRLADATLPVRLLLSDDASFCRKTAEQLDAFNKERQTIERAMCKEAEAMVERDQRDTPAIVVWNRDWHSGVVGIVAGRLSRQFNRATVVLGSEGVMAKGSGRSIVGINLTKALARCEDLLDTWGGHPMAVGIGMAEEQVARFRERFNEIIGQIIEQGEFEEPKLDISCWVEPDRIGSGLLKQMDLLGPFGEGNPEPVFGVRPVVLAQKPEVFGNGHFRFRLNSSSNGQVAGVAWGKADRVPPAGRPIEMALKLYWNQWNGQCYPQVELIDWREVPSQ